MNRNVGQQHTQNIKRENDVLSKIQIAQKSGNSSRSTEDKNCNIISSKPIVDRTTNYKRKPLVSKNHYESSRYKPYMNSTETGTLSNAFLYKNKTKREFLDSLHAQHQEQFEKIMKALINQKAMIQKLKDSALKRKLMILGNPLLYIDPAWLNHTEFMIKYYDKMLKENSEHQEYKEKMQSDYLSTYIQCTRIDDRGNCSAN